MQNLTPTICSLDFPLGIILPRPQSAYFCSRSEYVAIPLRIHYLYYKDQIFQNQYKYCTYRYEYRTHIYVVNIEYTR